MSDKIETLISQMTLEEKISLLAGADMWHTVPIKRLGIPVIKTTDGPLGARGADMPDAPTSACFLAEARWAQRGTLTWLSAWARRWPTRSSPKARTSCWRPR